MRTVYIIFSEVGWAWFAVVAAFLFWRGRVAARANRRRGFEVVSGGDRGNDNAK